MAASALREFVCTDRYDESPWLTPLLALVNPALFLPLQALVLTIAVVLYNVGAGWHNTDEYGDRSFLRAYGTAIIVFYVVGLALWAGGRTACSRRMAAMARDATPRAMTPRSATPRSATPRSATPRSATPRSATPRSATPRSATPRAAASPLGQMSVAAVEEPAAQPRLSASESFRVQSARIDAVDRRY
jgi:hypothetical protein